MNASTRGHHHATTVDELASIDLQPLGDLPNGIEGVRRKTSTNSDTPTEQERGQERTLESTDEDDGLCVFMSD